MVYCFFEKRIAHLHSFCYNITGGFAKKYLIIAKITNYQEEL